MSDKSTMVMKGLFGLLSYIPALNSICYMIYEIFYYLTIGEQFNTAGKEYRNPKSTDQGYNLNTEDIKVVHNDNGQVTMSIKNINLYISDSFLEILTKDEAIAILLHEIGHNTQLMLHTTDIIIDFWKPIIIGYIGYTGIFKVIKNEDTHIPTIALNDAFLKMIFLFILISIVFTYLSRRQEIGADTFAVKCGYGEELESTLKKMHNHSMDFYSKSADKISGFNIIDRIIRLITALLRNLYNILAKFKMSKYLDREAREKYVHDKTIEFKDLQHKNKKKKEDK